MIGYGLIASISAATASLAHDTFASTWIAKISDHILSRLLVKGEVSTIVHFGLLELSEYRAH